jgi:hypothetical protein
MRRKKNPELTNVDQERKTSHKGLRVLGVVGVLAVGGFFADKFYNGQQENNAQVQQLKKQVLIGEELNSQGIQYNKIGISNNNIYVSIDVSGKNIDFNDKITNTSHGPVDTLYLRVVGANNQQVGTTAVFNNSTTETTVLNSFKK